MPILGEGIVQLIFYYVGFMALGDVARLSHRSRGRARLAAGEPADLFGALLCLPVDPLAAGGEVDRAESQQTSRKVIFVIVLAEKASPLCCGALQARIPLLRAGESGRPMGANVRARTCAKRG